MLIEQSQTSFGGLITVRLHGRIHSHFLMTLHEYCRYTGPQKTRRGLQNLYVDFPKHTDKTASEEWDTDHELGEMIWDGQPYLLFSV